MEEAEVLEEVVASGSRLQRRARPLCRPLRLHRALLGLGSGRFALLQRGLEDVRVLQRLDQPGRQARLLLVGRAPARAELALRQLQLVVGVVQLVIQPVARALELVPQVYRCSLEAAHRGLVMPLEQVQERCGRLFGHLDA